jgi:hypothetical protein
MTEGYTDEPELIAVDLEQDSVDRMSNSTQWRVTDSSEALIV